MSVGVSREWCCLAVLGVVSVAALVVDCISRCGHRVLLDSPTIPPKMIKKSLSKMTSYGLKWILKAGFSYYYYYYYKVNFHYVIEIQVLYFTGNFYFFKYGF